MEYLEENIVKKFIQLDMRKKTAQSAPKEERMGKTITMPPIPLLRTSVKFKSVAM